MSQIPVFSGSFEQSLEHFSSQKGALGLLIEVTHAQRSTVEGWLKGKVKPEGLFLLQCFIFLEDAGYTIKEMTRVNPDLKKIVRAVAMGEIELQELKKKYRISSVRFYDHFLLRHKVSLEYKEIYKKIASDYRLEERQGQSEIPSRQTPNEERRLPDQKSGDEKAEIESLAFLLKAAMPLMKKIITDQFSAKDRESLRRLVDIHEIANTLADLASETSRNNSPYLKKKGTNSK